MRRIVATIAGGLCLGLLAGFFSRTAGAADDPVLAPQPPKRADFALAGASLVARGIADWVVDSGDNRGMPFVIVDKVDARVFVFHADGRLRGAAPALLGSARGDDAAPGIGNRPLSSIRPEERTTPAGRFEAALDRNLSGKEILWVDYDTSVSMHPVVTANAVERRAERLATETPLDNRISFGCINVPAKFFESVVQPAFRGTNGIVYVLPETRPAAKVFASYEVGERTLAQTRGPVVGEKVASSGAPGRARKPGLP